MSLRAIKKRENQLTPSSSQTRKTLFKKQTVFTSQQNKSNKIYNNTINRLSISNENAQQQQQLHLRLQLGRRAYSYPQLSTSGLRRGAYNTGNLVRTKSDGDIGTLLTTNNNFEGCVTRSNLINAKSEVCLQTITTHNYVLEHPLEQEKSKMMRGAHSHRELSQSAYGLGVSNTSAITVSAGRRRMSECSSDSYSQRTSSISASDLTLASPMPIRNDPNTVLRVPIIGYEVMEERARFTVYKLRVENPVSNDCWLVLRRYTDFVRLNTKLKQAFPYLTLMLPRKKLFGDNFNSVFLDNRVQGLQMFVNSIMAKEELRKNELVREFFCLDEPPSYSESMEECRAIFEAQEETISHLKIQIQNKNDLILSLQQKVREEIKEKEQLRAALSNLTLQQNASNNSK